MKTGAQGAAEEPRILLVGYGNVSRRDDGVALHVIRRLRLKLGLGAEPEVDEESDAAGNPATLWLHQLAPELAETLVAYDRVVFIDAHVGSSGWPPVSWQRIEPEYRPNIVAHHLKPGVVLALCASLYDRQPEGYALSILGHDFDFGEELSPETSRLADEAVARLHEWLCGVCA
ncbi:MAG: hydrogenase maturation protease [Chloroflexi bacterium]|nr:hydrogenase maturation protease [Chloroflexota bacterium]